MSLTKRYYEQVNPAPVCVYERDRDNICDPCNPNCAACAEERERDSDHE